jgi:putative transposase
MPRKARLTVVGAVHHVMSRGIEGTNIFRDDQDRAVFCKILDKRISQSGYHNYAWALLPNHYHLVIRVNEYPLSRFMRLINGEYARYFRKSCDKRGYLFQDRYKSIVTQDQNYIEELIRYVHLNPVRAGLCSSLQTLASYPWCGHGTLMGNSARLTQNVNDVLQRFGSILEEQKTAYVEFLRNGLEKEPEIFTVFRKSNNEVENRHDPFCWVIGNREFVEKALINDQNHKFKVQQYAKRGFTLKTIAENVAGKYGMDVRALMTRGRENARSEARCMFAHTAHIDYGFPVRNIATFFGVSSPAVSKMIWRCNG